MENRPQVLDKRGTISVQMGKGRQNKSEHNPETVETISSFAPELLKEALPILERLRFGAAQILAALPRPVRRAADVGKALDLDSTLAWNIFRLATAPDPLAAGPFVPGESRMRRLLAAAEAKGVPEQILASNREAFAEFQEVVNRHAADRVSFNSMIVDLQEAEPGKEDLKHKRAAYRANRYMCGVHADLSLATAILRPAAQGDGFDLAQIQGYVRIQQSRPHSTLLSAVGTLPEAGQYGRPIEEGDPSTSAISILKPFCSDPLPEFRQHTDANGMATTGVHSRALGSSGAVTYFLSSLHRNVWSQPIEPADERSFRSYIVVPVEVFVRDIWLHRSLWPNARARVESYWRRVILAPNAEMDSDERLPLVESATEMGAGLQAGSTSEIPRYTDMVRYVTEQIGWNADEFRLFRCRIEYPMLGSANQVFFSNIYSPPRDG